MIVDIPMISKFCQTYIWIIYRTWKESSVYGMFWTMVPLSEKNYQASALPLYLLAPAYTHILNYNAFLTVFLQTAFKNSSQMFCLIFWNKHTPTNKKNENIYW